MPKEEGKVLGGVLQRREDEKVEAGRGCLRGVAEIEDVDQAGSSGANPWVLRVFDRI